MICTICMSVQHRASKCPERRIKLAAVSGVCLLTVLLGGCPADRPVQYQPVKVVADTYCEATDDQSWSVNDTTETLDGVRRANAGRAAKCGARKK